MASLSSNQLGLTTARFGVMRFGASRFAFAPKDTRAPVPGGPIKSLYTWARIYPTENPVWTTVKS